MPPARTRFRPWRSSRKAGVTVFSGNDNIRDSWWPYGDGDMLGRAKIIGYRSGFYTDAELALAFDVVTTNGAKALRLEGYGLKVGAQGGLRGAGGPACTGGRGDAQCEARRLQGRAPRRTRRRRPVVTARGLTVFAPDRRALPAKMLGEEVEHGPDTGRAPEIGMREQPQGDLPSRQAVPARVAVPGRDRPDRRAAPRHPCRQPPPRATPAASWRDGRSAPRSTFASIHLAERRWLRLSSKPIQSCAASAVRAGSPRQIGGARRKAPSRAQRSAGPTILGSRRHRADGDLRVALGQGEERIGDDQLDRGLRCAVRSLAKIAPRSGRAAYRSSSP